MPAKRGPGPREQADHSARLFGFSTAAVTPYSTRRVLMDELGRVRVIHEDVPHERFIHFLDDAGRCGCDPHLMVLGHWDGRDIPVVSHNRFEMPGDDDDGFDFGLPEDDPDPDPGQEAELSTSVEHGLEG